MSNKIIEEFKENTEETKNNHLTEREEGITRDHFDLDEGEAFALDEAPDALEKTHERIRELEENQSRRVNRRWKLKDYLD